MRNGVRPNFREEQVVSIWSLASDGGCRDRATGSGAIFHHQRIAVGVLRETVREIARQRVGRPASPKRHEQSHGPLRPLRSALSKCVKR